MYYIVPPDKSKLEFLREHAKQVDLALVTDYGYNTDPDPRLVPVVFTTYGKGEDISVACILSDAATRQSYVIETVFDGVRSWFLCPIDVLDNRAGLADMFPAKLRSMLRTKENVNGTKVA